MNKSNEISKKLNSLESDAANLFSNILKGVKRVDFMQYALDKFEGYGIDDVLNDAVLPIVEVRNDMTGNVYDVYVESVDENGIHCSTTDEWEKKTFRFSDLSSLYDRLVLLNEMEELIG